MLSNVLATRFPDRVHAILAVGVEGDYKVSVRAPPANPFGADALCRRFADGGRVAAAGLARLARDRLSDFAVALDEAF